MTYFILVLPTFNENLDKILVVDDNFIIRNSICNLLKSIIEKSGIKYNIIVSDDGIDTLMLVKQDQKENHKIKCIITDEFMDFMDGSTSIKIIKELESNNKIKKINIVTISSSDDDISRLKYIRSGADSVITKPCSHQNLYNTLKGFNLI